MIEEVQTLVQALDISGEHAEEIINIFFEFFAEGGSYIDYLYNNIRVIRSTVENQMMISEIKTIDDVCWFEGDDYLLITNYQAILLEKLMEDCLPNPF